MKLILCYDVDQFAILVQDRQKLDCLNLEDFDGIREVVLYTERGELTNSEIVNRIVGCSTCYECSTNIAIGQDTYYLICFIIYYEKPLVFSLIAFNALRIDAPS